ncbi:hypothetical protein E2C01_051784 [Portunus trituberculatus]|uniref:Uncharacterized protein n=1 Tax=Portunus trituberculatus TaxID=210409 RepID=A0A5B7GJS5_PORTR|nr:hypothetical protein [Portunus trituberculatus]
MSDYSYKRLTVNVLQNNTKPLVSPPVYCVLCLASRHATFSNDRAPGYRNARRQCSHEVLEILYSEEDKNDDKSKREVLNVYGDLIWPYIEYGSRIWSRILTTWLH